MDRLDGGELLQESLSQKHIWPIPPDSSMQTWSTMNKLICNFEVHVRQMFSLSMKEGTRFSDSEQSGTVTYHSSSPSPL